MECVCRRWRRLALQLPSSLSIDMGKLHSLDKRRPGEAAAAALKRLLPHLNCRCIASLDLYDEEVDYQLSPEFPALLARAVYPELHRWVLAGC